MGYRPVGGEFLEFLKFSIVFSHVVNNGSTKCDGFMFLFSFFFFGVQDRPNDQTTNYQPSFFFFLDEDRLHSTAAAAAVDCGQRTNSRSWSKRRHSSSSNIASTSVHQLLLLACILILQRADTHALTCMMHEQCTQTAA